MINWKQWLSLRMRSGDVCMEYMRHLQESICMTDFFDLCLDVNGMEFLCEMSAKDGGLPYESIKEDFSRYINGQYEARHGDGDVRYTSEMWLGRRGGEIHLTNTATLLLDCKDVNIRVPDNFVGILYVDDRSSVSVDCPARSTLYVNVYGDGNALFMGGKNVHVDRR